MASDYDVRQILNEMREQTKLLKEIKTAIEGVERAVYDVAPGS